MKNILVFNVGSSSVKYAFYHGRMSIQGNVERVKDKAERLRVVRFVAKQFSSQKIDAVCHRVVHGGSLTKPIRVTKKTIKQLHAVEKLAPLHDKPEVEVIEFCMKLFSSPNYAVFDTAFHQTMPEYASLYAIPKKLRSQGFRKYGFHGISHQYVTRGLKGKVISCHLGSGASICAIQNGRSIDTSMGFTPLDGLIMGTRAGEIDTGLVLYLEEQGYSQKKISEMLNKKSGLLGISGISNDLRDLLKLEKENKNAKLAIDAYVYRIVKYIGSYVAALGGVDTIVFTAGTGERSALIRKKVCEKLAWLGVKLDASANEANQWMISSKKSKVFVLVVPTNEEKAIAQTVEKLVSK